jgi:CubicO group peptidase (beta-lactamase class C family)
MARLRRAGLHLLAPEFAQYGKERITVRQLLAHQAGLYALDESIDRDLVVTSIGWQWC